MTRQIAIFILFVAGFGVAVAYTTLGGRSASTVKTASATTASFSEAASAATEEKKYPAPPEMKIDVNKTYTATLTTTKGDIVLTLFRQGSAQDRQQLCLPCPRSFL